MLQIGDVVEALVTRIEPYGLWLDCQGTTILVNIPEIAWHRIRHPGEYTHVGCHVLVEIIHVDLERQKVAASVRRLYPERNPWRHAHRWRHAHQLRLGERHVAMVVGAPPGGHVISVEFGAGINAVLVRNPGNDHLRAGDTIAIRLTSIDRDRQRVEAVLDPTPISELQHG
jgi:small subunit ribosomal protein S1